MTGPNLLVATLGLALISATITPAASHSLKNLENQLRKRETYVQMTNNPAPGFMLQDANGRAVKLSDFKGTVVVLNFIYATCRDVCPLQSERIAEIQELVNGTPMRDLVQFISITTDPKRDTWQALKQYGAAHGLDPANWVFLTSGSGRPAATRELAERYGLKFVLIDDEYQMHATVTHLIDKSGNLRARYHGLKFSPTNMIVHINALTNDYH